MADNNQQPQFLGGGPKFNRAGAQPPVAETGDSPQPVAPNRGRTWLIVTALVILIGLLYLIMTGPNGMHVQEGHGGVSPTQHTIAPNNDMGQ